MEGVAEDLAGVLQEREITLTPRAISDFSVRSPCHVGVDYDGWLGALLNHGGAQSCVNQVFHRRYLQGCSAGSLAKNLTSA
jgi:hypothetical protein